MDEATIQLIESHLGVKVNFAAWVLTVVILNRIGSTVKKLPHIADEWIPIVLAGVGMVLYVLLSLSLSAYTPASWVIGVICGGFAVGLHQGFRQTGALLNLLLGKSIFPPTEPNPSNEKQPPV
jgi:hypothetical protein